MPATIDSAAELARRQAATELDRRQAQELELQQDRAEERPDVWSGKESPATQPTAQFPVETPCFAITRIHWDGPAPPRDVQAASQAAVNHCVGVAGLRTLQEHLQGMLIDQGLITSRVLIPEQSLATGQLALRYVPGRISSVTGEGAPGWWRMAVPTGPGGTVNQRDLDQTLENIRRLEGQADAIIDIAPGPELGDSDILIRPGSGKRWHGYVGGDNAGYDAIGKYQLNAGLTLDSPLFLYDELSVAWNGNTHWRDADANNRAASVSYSVPFGYWTAFANASKSSYRQPIAGYQIPIVYGGITRQVQAGVSVVPYRGGTYKGNASLSLSRRRVSHTLNDVDIDVQRRDLTGYEFSLGHRHYLERAVVGVNAGVRGTIAGWSSQPGYVYGDPDWSGRSTILSASAGVYLPFEAAGQSLAYQGNWQIQHATTPIVPIDYFTIGSRYAVRGFDGQMTLAAEDGWSLRNDLSLNLGNFGIPGQQLYAGVDVGRVGGPSAQSLSGRTLTGAVAGLRGYLAVPYVTTTYDLSAGWPLAKPESLKTASTVFAASLTFSF